MRTAVLVPLLGVAALLLSSCGSDDRVGGSLLGVVRTPALDVSEVGLLDVTEAEPEPFAVVAPEGEVRVLYFGYTSCPDICPTTMSDVSVAVNDLPAELADRVTVGMVTVDPERDTPDVLSAYLGSFFDDPVALRAADDAALEEAAAAFGVRFEVADHEPGDTGYEVSHSAVTYVVDDTGSVVVEWPFGFDSEQMTRDLETILGG